MAIRHLSVKLKSLLIALLIGLLVPAGAYAQSGGLSGFWTMHGTVYKYKFESKFELTESIDGHLLWTLLIAPSGQEMIGKQGKEFVRGTFNPVTRELLIKGYRKEDPHGILSLDEYRLVVSPDGKSVQGTTFANGTWLGRIDPDPAEAGGMSSERKARDEKESAEKRKRDEEERKQATSRQESERAFAALMTKKSDPQMLYLRAGKLEREGDTAKARRLYDYLVEAFSSSSWAVKANDRLLAMGSGAAAVQQKSPGSQGVPTGAASAGWKVGDQAYLWNYWNSVQKTNEFVLVEIDDVRDDRVKVLARAACNDNGWAGKGCRTGWFPPSGAALQLGQSKWVRASELLSSWEDRVK